MNEIIQLDDHKNKWFPAKCLCVNCSNIWTGVINEDRQCKLECPECSEMKGAAIINYYEMDSDL